MPVTEKMLRDAHVGRHRVGRRLADLAKLNAAEREIFDAMKSADLIKLEEGKMIAYLEPRRFSVNWHQVAVKGHGPKKIATLIKEAEERTAEAKRLFGDSRTRWTKKALAMERLVIEGH